MGVAVGIVSRMADAKLGPVEALMKFTVGDINK